jgi:long-subunit fatty acid transport protein
MRNTSFMRNLLLLLFLVGSLATAQAQSKGYGDNDTITMPDGLAKKSIKDRLHFGVSMGSSVSFGSNQGASMGHFIAPTLSFQVTDKFTVFGGVALQYNSLNNPYTYNNPESGSSIMLMRPRMQTSMFVGGEYAVNEKLTLTGSVFANTASLTVPGLNPQTYNLNNYGVSGGFWYKINDKASIGAQVQISRGSMPFNPYRSNTGFGNNNFGTGFGSGVNNPYAPIGTW